jgi:VanZ family protein
MRRVLRFAPALAIMGLIYYLSAQPDLGTGIEGWDAVLRKLGHVAVFAALFLALLYALPDRPATAAAIAVLYAISDEWHQTFTDGRHGSPVDVLIDGVGIGVAWLVAARAGWSTASPAPSR